MICNLPAMNQAATDTIIDVDSMPLPYLQPDSQYPASFQSIRPDDLLNPLAWLFEGCPTLLVLLPRTLKNGFEGSRGLMRFSILIWYYLHSFNTLLHSFNVF